MKLQRKNKLIVVMLVVIIALSAFYASTLNRPSEQKQLQAISSADPEPFYLGVTYCGNSVADAKQLIDKVKGYTNLIIIQWGN